MNVLSLFTGAGGLDLGLEAAGFHVAGCVERDRDCRRTIADNTSWRVASEGDAEKLDVKRLLEEFELKPGEVTLVAGGPPCQPFSKSGQWSNGTPARMSDPRARTLHAYFDVLDAALPRVMVLENVKGLVAKPRAGSTEEQAVELLARVLEDVNGRHGTSYRPSIIHVDAADLGVPQRRERVFVLAERSGLEFAAPQATHGRSAPDGAPRFTTAWDALADLDSDDWDPALAAGGQWAGLLPSIPEGRNYLHHTRKGDGEPLFGWRRKYWSFLLKLAKDRPSWTIQAQPGSATGPFHWRNRRLSAREMARLQTFPDTHRFSGGYTSVRRQIGNAVPVALGEVLGLAIRTQLLGHMDLGVPSSLPRQRHDCPPAEVPAPVPTRYLALRGDHDDHPGPGQGPRGVQIKAGTRQ
ncbi:DNA cytosine methyltransferase [Capillimicrobium parvum]|uniref:DNA (cytosine-5-)-methyltransferase n=1 Tax=Capillimicrobium parvum TaxID=2884022 RepID=A0A9E6XVV2_9ACTN|nr:DNA cytosine methyltransferase [Capillimicrobium parvum]UGS35344.1 Modification methylase HaeIII [Capillimicrobium parvum]